ncbi:MAG TPA: type II secretion system protein, partial [Dongiaceae bacterium]|nr:type II secretion system protein [Dongiaceae bacterium]
MKTFCRKSKVESRRAFTLIEIMMVVAILGLVMAMGVPGILAGLREEPMRKAVNDVVEICGHARAMAILSGKTTTVVFHPHDKTIEGGDAPAGSVSTRNNGKVTTSAQFDNSITIKMLGINQLVDTDAEIAGVRFFPNGTSDEMTIIFQSGDQTCTVTLEVTTALASATT